MDRLDDPSLASRIEDLMNKHHVPGLSVAIVRNDQVSSAGYGVASYEPPVPCTAETLFDVASCAKSLTAASIALLIEDNEEFPEIQYDTIMSNLLPEDFVMSGSGYTEGVTVEDLLGHRTGMAPHDNSYFGPQAKNADNAQSITRNLRNLAVAAPIRSRYLYCNMMYTVLTHLVEVKSKQPFSEFLDKRIFTPLGMESSNLQPSNANTKGLGDRIAAGYIWEKSSGYHKCESVDCPEGQGAGSIITSANDFIKFVKALINQEGPISKKVYQGLVKSRSFPHHYPARLKQFTSPPIYAAGMEVYYYRGYMVVGHNGVISGFGSRFAFIPDIRFGAVIMGNSAGAGPVANILIRELIDEFLGIPKIERSAAMRTTNSATISPTTAKDKTKKRNKREPRDHSKVGVAEKGNGQQQHDPPEPQIKALDLYTGNYWNAGYRGIQVQIKDNRLFIDASDRAMGFTLTFHHIRNQTEYISYLVDDVEGGSDPVEAEFVFKEGQSKDGEVIALGLRLERSLKDMIWFEKINDSE